MIKSRWEKVLFLLVTCFLIDQVWSKKEPCTDYPSCQLISDKMFENYCTRSTLKNMCPTHCDKNCQKTTTEQSSSATDETSYSAVTPTEQPSSKDGSSSSNNSENEEEEAPPVTSTTTTTTTTTTNGRKKPHKHRKPGKKQQTTTSTVITTTVETPKETTSQSDAASAENEDDGDAMEINTKSTTTTTLKTTTKSKSMKQQTTTKPSLHTEIPDGSSETTRKVASNLPNGTIYVPLFEAGFVQRVIPTSSKEGYDFSKAKVCKKSEDCDEKNTWCPLTNDVPKEQLEVLLNYTTDIYMLETQGSVFKNETVTSFLFQYLNEAGILVSRLFRTDTNNSTEINKFKFEPPFRTNYIRITPIDYFISIAFRFEIYSKGILYNPSTE